MSPVLLLAKTKKPEVIIAADDLQMTTACLWLAVVALLAFFALRPRLWRRLVLKRVDPRPAALIRIFLGITILWTVADLLIWGRFLFTDEGLYLTDMARERFGDRLRKVWDPEQGFESVPMMFGVLASKWTVLHMRSDPPFVWGIFAATMAANVAMIVGWRTRISTALTFLGVMQIYNYSPIWYAGGDTVTRTMIFLGLFCRWGEAYSVDTWRRRKRAILGGATSLPALRAIPVWPQRIMVLQLAIIYCATGLLKSGSTWGVYGSAIYYAMNLDHFYRMPLTGLTTLLQRSGVLMVSTWVVHWWESLFPILLVGLAVRDYERARTLGDPEGWLVASRTRRRISWVVLALGWIGFALATRIAIKYYYDPKYLPKVLELGEAGLGWFVFGLMIALPTAVILGYRSVRRRRPGAHAIALRWLFGKRVWLTMGVMMHLGIEVSMNVGTFVQVMIAIYPAFLRGRDVTAIWRYVGSSVRRPETGGVATLRQRVNAWVAATREASTRGDGPRWLSALLNSSWVHRLARPLEAGPVRWVSDLVSREPGAQWTVLHAPDDRSVRRAALLRCWDVMELVTFECVDAATPGELWIRDATGDEVRGPLAAARLGRIFPGLWCVSLPGVLVEVVCGRTRCVALRRMVGRVHLRLLGQR